MSTTSGYGVVSVSHVAMFSNFGGTCGSNNLRLRPSAGLNGGLNSFCLLFIFFPICA